MTTSEAPAEGRRRGGIRRHGQGWQARVSAGFDPSTGERIVEPQHFARNLDPQRADQIFANVDWRGVDQLPADEKRAHIADKLIAAIRATGFSYVIPFGLEATNGRWPGVANQEGVKCEVQR